MKPTTVHEGGSDERPVKRRRRVTEHLLGDTVVAMDGGNAAGGHAAAEKKPFDATFGLTRVFDSTELPVFTKSSMTLADELINYASTATGASLQLPRHLWGPTKPTLEELCATRVIAAHGSALLAPAAAAAAAANGPSAVERLLSTTPPPTAPPTQLAAGRPYTLSFADEYGRLFPPQPPPHAAAQLQVALDPADVAPAPTGVGWAARAGGAGHEGASRPPLGRLVRERLAAAHEVRDAGATGVVDRLLSTAPPPAAPPRPPPLDPLRALVAALAASAPPATAAADVDLDLADVSSAAADAATGRTRRGAAFSSEAFSAVFGTVATLGRRPLAPRPAAACGGVVTERLLSSGHALRCIPIQPPRRAPAPARTFLAALGDAVPGLRPSPPRTSAQMHPRLTGRARALRAALTDILDAPPPAPVPLSRAPCGRGGLWEGPGGMRRFLDAALLPPRRAPPPRQPLPQPPPQETGQQAAVSASVKVHEVEPEPEPAPEPEPEFTEAVCGQVDLVARYLALRGPAAAPASVPAPTRAAPQPAAAPAPVVAPAVVPAAATAMDRALAAPPKAGRMNGLCVLVSEPFIESRPAAVAALAADHGVTCLDCPLEPPLAAVIDAVTAVAVLPLRTATVRASLKDFFRQLTKVAFKFRRVWVVVVHDAEGVAGAAAGMADLHSTLSQFPLEVVVREASAAALPAVLFAACDQAAGAACVARDCLRSAYVARPFLAAFRGDGDGGGDGAAGVAGVAFAEHCAFLQQFPTVNYFLAAQLLHAAARGSGKTLRGLARLLPDCLPALLHEVCKQHYSGKPAAMGPVAHWVEQMSALLTTHCGLEMAAAPRLHEIQMQHPEEQQQNPEHPEEQQPQRHQQQQQQQQGQEHYYKQQHQHHQEQEHWTPPPPPMQGYYGHHYH